MNKGMASLTMVTIAATTFTASGSALASDAPSGNDRVVSMARAVDPTRGVVSGGDLRAVGAGVEAVVGGHRIQLSAEDPSRARSFSDASGASLYSVLENGSQRATFRSSLPEGAVWEPKPDGGLNVVVRSGAASLILAHVAPPFAVDATGKRLPTRYKVGAANVIEQEVDTRGAKFPVAADPKLTYGWGIYLNAFGYEWKSLFVAVSLAGGVGAWGSCSLIKVAGTWGNILKTACSGIGITSLKSIIKWALGNWTRLNLNGATCYQTKIAPRDGRLKAVSFRNCH